MRNFRTYKVWHHAIDLVTKTYQVVQQLPQNEMYSLSQQMRRAVVSIPSNIAEGCGRSSDKEFKRFIEIALSSAFELETQMIIGDNLFQIKESVGYAQTYSHLIIVQKELNALRNKL
jgi:four helix bundle protein